MFQQLLRDVLGTPNFKARSAERNAHADRVRVSAVLAAIDKALQDVESERAGLAKRVDDVLARCAVTIGNGDDEYLEREPALDHHQSLLSTEISVGQKRLAELERTVEDLRHLKATALARFPNFDRLEGKGDEPV